jgi:hypothetical protein
VIRWGPNTSNDKLRRCARCTACGNKGATIQHPGWGGNDVGFLPFPVEMVTPRAGVAGRCSVNRDSRLRVHAHHNRNARCCTRKPPVG